jgi:DNA-binding NarL/FixJ family response regulator
MTTEVRPNLVLPRTVSVTEVGSIPYGLSEQELDVLFLLRNGLYEADIAEALDLHQAVVKEQVRSLLHKMNARSKTEAAVMAIREGIFSASRS